jgi:signal transduction histidine kinase
MMLVLGVTAFVLLAVAVPIAILVRDQVEQNGRQQTIDQANSVGLYLHNGDRTHAQITAEVVALSRASGRPTMVTCPDGTVIGSLPAGVLPDAAHPVSGGRPGSGQPSPPGNGPEGSGNPGPGGSGNGGSPGHSPGDLQPDVAQLTAVHGGSLATLHAGYSNGDYVVRVYASDARLRSGATDWLWLLVGASAGMLVLAAGSAELVTRRIVRPLLHTAATAHALSLGDTTARAPLDGPGEITQMGLALNRLADRIDELIAEERETVADLSHRLRTPLTALRLDAEALRDPTEAERVSGHVNALERTLTAVIRAARRPQREGRLPACDATAVVAERVAFWSALTDEQQRTATVELPSEPLLVRAAAEDLAAAVDALLENVVAHTPEGTAFFVKLAAMSGGARLEIADAGPGLPAAAEVRGRSDRGSSGLGLDIARRCAEATGGAMRIGSRSGGGASITLELRSP